LPKITPRNEYSFRITCKEVRHQTAYPHWTDGRGAADGKVEVGFGAGRGFIYALLSSGSSGGGKLPSLDDGRKLPSLDAGLKLPSLDDGRKLPSLDAGLKLPSFDAGRLVRGVDPENAFCANGEVESEKIDR